MRQPGRVRTIACALSFGVAAAASLPALPSRAQDAEAEAPATPRIYRWIDENGIAHYTTDPSRIPSGLSEQVGDFVATPLEAERIEPRAPVSRTRGETWVSRDRGTPSRSDGDIWDDGSGDFVSEPVVEAPEIRVDRSAEIASLREQISSLEAEIRADEAALKAFITDPASGGPLVTGEQPEFRTIALRLPERLRELRELRNQRNALENE